MGRDSTINSLLKLSLFMQYGSTASETEGEEGEEEDDDSEPVVKLGSCDVVQVSPDMEVGSHDKVEGASTTEEGMAH